MISSSSRLILVASSGREYGEPGVLAELSESADNLVVPAE